MLVIIVQVAVLVAMSALCSGLNISLMALQPDDLRRKAKLGQAKARRVLPLRHNSHLTLASILLTNVALISATSLVLDQELEGLIAGIISTLLIVIFGEVIPQALFAQHALSFTAFFAPLLRLMIFITYPVSKPLQLLLDKLIGKQQSLLVTRSELGIIINEHLGARSSELDEDEVAIMKSTLQLSEKRVRDIMTDINQVFWLQPATIIDGKLIEAIKVHSRSRIPVFNRALTRCYGVVLMKELVDIDFEAQPMPVEELPLHPTTTVGSMTALDTLFRKFISAHTHLMPIERDDRIVGIVTIEDLIEEILGHEIEDESDRRPRPLIDAQRSRAAR